MVRLEAVFLSAWSSGEWRVSSGERGRVNRPRVPALGVTGADVRLQITPHDSTVVIYVST